MILWRCARLLSARRSRRSLSARGAAHRTGSVQNSAMCNLYSLTKGQAAIREWFRARHDRTGNLPLFPGIFPDQIAPIARTGVDGERELVMARWGMPGAAAVRRPARDQHSQRREPALARMARQEEPLHRPRNVVLRIPGHEAAQDAHMVRLERRSAALRLRWPMDALAWSARPEERARRGRP